MDKGNYDDIQTYRLFRLPLTVVLRRPGPGRAPERRI